MGRAAAEDNPSRVAAEWVRRRLSATPTAPTVPTALPSGSPCALVMGDPAPHLAAALKDAGFAVDRWNRRLSPGQECAPWPPPDPCSEVWVRMPSAGLEAAMLLSAAAFRVRDGSSVYLFGANNQGIRSAAKRFPPGSGPAELLLAKRRCRVICAARQTAPPGEDALAAWEVAGTVDWGTGRRSWTFYPGVFACGRMDPATALLARSLPALGERARILDFGAGTGMLAAAALEKAGPDATALLLDTDAVALAAAARNVPQARQLLASGVADAPGPFDLIVSNPPLHAGKRESLRTIQSLAADAPNVLSGESALLVVAPRKVPLGPLLNDRFREARVVAEHGLFRVWRGHGPRSPRRS